MRWPGWHPEGVGLMPAVSSARNSGVARIEPIEQDEAHGERRTALDEVVAAHGRATNMKRTLARSPVALRSLMTWYDLRDEVVTFLGERATILFAHAISAGTDCLICSTFFRRILIDAGDDPDNPRLDERERLIVEFGRQLARDPHGVGDELFRPAFALVRRRSDRGAHGLRRSDGRDQPVQQRAPGRPRRVSLELPKKGDRRGASRMSEANSRPPELRGQVALITGAAHGQGRASALALAREGAHVVALDVARPLEYPGYGLGTSADLESLCDACRALGVECLTFAADVRDDAAVSAAVTAAVEHFGRIDILFNNAGICAYGLAHELTEEAWDAMLDINLKGAWIVARRVIPHMIARRSGVIINNSSVAGLRGMARLSHYAASKWGLVGLTKSWAIELAPHGIRVDLDPSDRRQYANERRPGRARGPDAHASRRALGRQPASGPLGRARRRGRGRRVPGLASERGSSPARSSCWTRGC